MDAGSQNLYTDFTTKHETYYEPVISPSTSTALKMPTTKSSMINIPKEEKNMQELSRNLSVKPSTVTSSNESVIYDDRSSLATFKTSSMVRFIPSHTTTEEFKQREPEVIVVDPPSMSNSISTLTSEYPKANKDWYHSIPEGIIPSNHRIYINPSIIQIKNEPLEPEKNLTIKKKSKKSKRSKRRRFACSFNSFQPNHLARYILNIQADSKNQDVKTENHEKQSNEPPKQQSTVIERQRKRSDARLWLQAKAQLVAQAQSATNKTNSSIKLQTSSPIKRFVDRATSPIDFKDEQIKPKTCDVALSPIKYIEPNLKRRSNGNYIDLSAKSSPIPLKHKCLLHAHEHKCSKCEMVKHPDKCCPTCYAVSALSTSK